MNDIELLELAALAAGKAIDQKTFGEYQDAHRGMVVADGEHWNPLNDDGDALRLAVKLGISVFSPGFAEYHNGGDVCAAVRLAIVRAAAEIGKRMIEQENKQ